ncbi:uncharacterized protein IL334_002725 [Kwoniella shivajii]|uniref:EKC/KEOPS complex subunit CGI121 n=1 Tax=Kwoniella shivajii TaxID=564305 RepID=A0ABZ1CVX0_9TREE|nr:hypothetical protein IL334_002725 [Kwoniella shivajii]
MESYTLPSFPSTYSTIHIALFENVTNSSEIKERLVKASITPGEQGDKLRSELDYGFIEASVLVSKEHLLTSIMTTLLYSFPSQSNDPASISLEPLSMSNSSPNHAVDSPSNPPISSLSSADASNTQVKPKTRTHNLHSELLLSLSPNNNITDSIRRHGISDQTKTLAVVRISGSDQTPEQVYQGISRVVKGDLVGWDKIENVTDWNRVDKIYKLSEINSLKSPDVRAKKRAAVVSSVAVKNVI